MKKILVPFDFTAPSENALDLATQISERDGSAEIVLFHVIEHPSCLLRRNMGGCVSNSACKYDANGGRKSAKSKSVEDNLFYRSTPHL